MTDEVGPNDPNRGRSSAGRFKMPFSKPIAVRDVDDVFDAAWGGMRKPKTKEERRSMQVAPDLSGGGYTPAQTNQDRWKIILVFVLVPVALFGFLSVVGWLTDSQLEDPVPISTSCAVDGFRATYRSADFHENASRASFRISLVDENGAAYVQTVSVELQNSSSEIVEVVLRDPLGLRLQQCEVVGVELFR